jgi:transcriptional regulator with XRE-family HTH domain
MDLHNQQIKETLMKEKVKQSLKSERYSFHHLASRMGYSTAYLSKIFNKKQKAPERFFFILCACLNDMTGSSFTTQDFKEYIND